MGLFLFEASIIHNDVAIYRAILYVVIRPLLQLYQHDAVCLALVPSKNESIDAASGVWEFIFDY
jgi:hypothetical protein